ncbi:hypothetical protein MVEN_00784100 [Mycena venus]|uniref:Fungal N-terminal domain-containing protein n=1 Tax=Mycena venus TaxID=2733690 RepID=A0A8H6YLP1_9AGAR|nr:hypothetical protein MVEN_00784100 [Mycena venus]
MPVLAIAYGSFGDILATAQLVARVVILLRNGIRSAEYAETEKELKSLGADLANLTLIPVDEALQSSPMALSVATRIQEEVRRCHLLILKFFEKLSSSNGLIRKIMWAASQDRELVTLRMRIIERRMALSVVVGMMNSGMLLAVQDRVCAGNSQIRDVLDGVSCIAQQLTIYQQQIVAVVRHVSHGVSEETFVVVSPAGVSIPFPLVYCRTYKDLRRILNAYLCGRLYSLISSITSGEADYDSKTEEFSAPATKHSTTKDFTTVVKAGVHLQLVHKEALWSGGIKCAHCARMLVGSKVGCIARYTAIHSSDAR